MDGYFYSELMQEATGDEMKYASGYSIYPVFGKGLFHPKVWMFFGKDEGLLVIGSGNLTHSGCGGNDEIWGAFHFDSKHNEHRQLFGTAWSYLSRLAGSAKGIMAGKTTQWITEEAPWLSSLPTGKETGFSELKNGDQVVLLHNEQKNGIFAQMRSLMAKEKITEITVASPYYDRKGKVITEMMTNFSPTQFNIIVEEFGSLPFDLAPNKKYGFYDWKNAGVSRSMYGELKSRMHAKFIHFRTQKGVEYCLFGSANLTPEGMGVSSQSNDEFCLFVKSPKGGFFERLGIKLKPGLKKQLKAYSEKPVYSVYQSIIKNNRFPIRLLAADVSYGVFNIYSEGEIPTGLALVILNERGNILLRKEVDEYRPVIEWKTEIDESNVKYLQFIFAHTGLQASNKVLVGNYVNIAKTHPSPKNAELEQLCNRLQNGELRNVLDLLQYAIIDETEKTEGVVVKSGKVIAKKDKVQSDTGVLYDIQGYRPKEAGLFGERSLLMSPSLRVLDVLKLSHYNRNTVALQVNSTEQTEDISAVNNTEQDFIEEQSKNYATLRLLDSDRRKLRNFFKNLYGYFHEDVLFKENKVSDYKLSLTDFTKYLIGLELIHEFGGKGEMVVDEQRQLFLTYLPQTGQYDNDNVKGCCLNIIGDFLRLSKNGFKTYEFDYTRKKFEQIRREALVSTIACILNTPWSDSESMYMKTLLLNTVHYLGWHASAEIVQQMPILELEVDNKIRQLKQPCAQLEEHRLFFHRKLHTALETSAKKREKRQFTPKASRGQIIYSSIAGVGYCYVMSVSSKNEYQLARPGFAWNHSASEFMNHFGDGVYQPITLPQVTIVEI